MKLYKLILLLGLTAVFWGSGEAHYMWIETNPTGAMGEKHTVKVYYGEYTYDYYEKVDTGFVPVNKFSLIVLTPDRQKVKLECTPHETYYAAEFTPDKNGVYQVLLTNEDIDVVDWREWDLGVVKQGFYSSAVVNVGEGFEATDQSNTLAEVNKLIIYSLPNNEQKINTTHKVRAVFDKKPLAESELSVSIPGGWVKKIYTDENGEAEFSVPLEGLVVIEVVHTEDTSGSFKEKDYENIRNVATFSTILTE